MEHDKLIERLRELTEQATPGKYIAQGWGDGSTQMGMTNVFIEDAEVLLMECIPEEDADLIVALRNGLPDMLDLIQSQASQIASLSAALTCARLTITGLSKITGNEAQRPEVLAMIDAALASTESSHD